MVTSAYPSAATFAFEKVISGVSPADAQFGFERPVFAQEPGVAVCDTDSTEPTLVAVVLELREVGAEEFEVGVDISG